MLRVYISRLTQPIQIDLQSVNAQIGGAVAGHSVGGGYGVADHLGFHAQMLQRAVNLLALLDVATQIADAVND